MKTQAQLEAIGYTVEDMGAVWGEDFAGQYRWINKRHTQDQGDGFGVIQYSEGEAWSDAVQFEARYGF